MEISRIGYRIAWLAVMSIVLSVSPVLAANDFAVEEGGRDLAFSEFWADVSTPGGTNNVHDPLGPDTSFATDAPAFAGESWSSGFILPGVDKGVVYAVAPDDNDDTYVGGRFTQVGSIAANYIARWDGRNWQALGLGVGDAPFTTVYALLNDGHGNLYVGGSFETAGEIDAHNIARWDGNTWHTLGAGVNGTVRSLALDEAGNLYVGGSFTMAGASDAANVAKWDGNNWSALGEGLTFVGGPFQAIVTALEVDQTGNLYAGGWFTFAGQVASSHVARWDGTQWYAVPAFTHVTVSPAVTDLQIGRDGQLYIAGTFSGHVCKWDGVQCSILGTGLGGRFAGGANAIAFDDQGNLYTVGYFSTAGTTDVRNVAMWDGTAWHPLGNGLDGKGRSLEVTGYGELILGGGFRAAGTVAASGIASWDGANYHPLGSGNGLGGYVNDMAMGPSGNLFVGGYFSAAGTADANNIARWDGSRWFPLGEGVDSFVYSLAIDAQDNLFAGGNFVSAGGVEANNVARWNGHAWQPLLTGLDDQVNSLALDSEGNLYAGGLFHAAGGVSASYIASWDGARWSPLDSGMNNSVFALIIGADGYLYAGGNFTMAGGVSANHVARWNGTTWSALGQGTDGTVEVLAVDNVGQIYAGGLFENAGGVTANGIARWDGSRWHSVGSGVTGAYRAGVHAITFDNANTVYVGGNFEMAGSIYANNIAQWRGNSWQAFGSGTDSYVLALELDPAGHLYAGGLFSTAGNLPSVGIALWGAVDRQCNLTVGSYSFSVDDGPVVIDIIVPGTIDCISVEHFSRVHPWATPLQATDHYWQILASDSNGRPAEDYTVDMTLPANFTPDADDTLCRYDGGPWNCAASTFSASNKTITRNGVNQLGAWAIGQPGQSHFVPYLP